MCKLMHRLDIVQSYMVQICSVGCICYTPMTTWCGYTSWLGITPCIYFNDLFEFSYHSDHEHKMEAEWHWGGAIDVWITLLVDRGDCIELITTFSFSDSDGAMANVYDASSLLNMVSLCCPSGPVRLTPYSACSASFFSRNSVFLSQ